MEVGRAGENVLPRVSRRSERRGLLSSSCPMKKVEPRGIAPRSTQCHCVVLLLDDGPEMERAPGLAPGKSGFASRRLDDFGIARFWKWGGRRVLPPLGDLHRIECWLLHHGLHLKVIRLRVPPPSGLAYKASA